MSLPSEPLRGRASLSACAALALACALLTGCPKAPKVVTKRLPGTVKERTLKVSVNIAQEANGGNPVALDLVLVSDKDLLKELQKMTAGQWFERREQIVLDHPKRGELVVVSREWAPGQVVAPDSLKVAPEVRAAVVFANYFNPGEHRAVLDPRRDFLIKLGEEKIEVVAERK
jgi:predicted component of type VI protein secretion system